MRPVLAPTAFKRATTANKQREWREEKRRREESREGGMEKGRQEGGRGVRKAKEKEEGMV